MIFIIIIFSIAFSKIIVGHYTLRWNFETRRKRKLNTDKSYIQGTTFVVIQDFSNTFFPKDIKNAKL